MLVIYHLYVREDVGRLIVHMRNEPEVSLFRSKDEALRSRFSVLRVPISSKGTSIGVESDFPLDFFVTRLEWDAVDVPLNNIDRRVLAGLIIQNTCKCWY